MDMHQSSPQWAMVVFFIGIDLPQEHVGSQRVNTLKKNPHLLKGRNGWVKTSASQLLRGTIPKGPPAR